MTPAPTPSDDAPPYVLDTSALLSGKQLPRDVPLTAPDAILDEVTPGGRDHRNLTYLRESGLTIQRPTDEAMDRVEEAARETGDLPRLSHADRAVLALALELEGTVLTDDYSLQNVASELDVPFRGINQEGIQRQVRWKHRCRACYREAEAGVEECPVCGSEVITVRDRG